MMVMSTTLMRYIIRFTAMLLLVACNGEQSQFEPSGKVVKVGFLGPLSGVEKSVGENSLLGVKAAMKLQPYLQNGDLVELVLLDDQGDPEVTKDALNALVKEASFSALLYGSSSSVVLSMTSYLDQLKIPTVALRATHPDVTNAKCVVQLPFDDSFQGTVAALFVMDELIIDKVAVFVEPEDIHSAFLADTFTDTFKEAGGQVELIDYPNSQDALKQMLQHLQNMGTQLLYLPINGSKVVNIARRCREIDYHPEVMLSDGVLSRIYLDHTEDVELVEGMMACDVFTFERLSKDYGTKIKEAFERSSTALGTTYTALGAEGMSILLQAMQGCNDSSDRECVNRKLHAISGFSGINGQISISSEGKSERPIFINKIVEGKLVFKVMVY